MASHNCDSLELMDNGILRVATEGDFPPFSFVKGDSVVGIESTVMTEVCKRLNLRYAPQVLSWSCILEQLEAPSAGTFDMSSASMDLTEERRSLWAFTRSYYAAETVLVSPMSAPLDAGSIRGRRVATIERSTFVNALRAAGAEPVCTAAVGDVWLCLLQEGRVEAFATEKANAQSLRQLSPVELYISPEPLATQEKAFAMPFGRPRLLAAVDEALAAMERDGVLQKLVAEGIAQSGVEVEWSGRSDRLATQAPQAEDVAELPRLSEAFATGKREATEGQEMCEACVQVSTKHYPRGLNANFLLGDEAQIVDEHIGKFEDPEKRDIAKAVPEIMQMLKTHAGLSESSSVADIGAGTGLILKHLAPAAKHVFASEISHHFIAHLRKQVKVWRFQNVTVVAGTAEDPHLPPDSIDIALVCDVYHHFEYPKTVCRHLKSALRQGGRLVVIDFIRDEAVHRSHPPGWITEHVRAGQEVFRREIESVGFRHLCEPALPSLIENYCMVFE